MKMLYTMLLAVALCSCGGGDDDHSGQVPVKPVTPETTEADMTIDPQKTSGTILWGFDIKQHNVCQQMDATLANALFSGDGFKMLRIGIWPCEHLEDGTVNPASTTYKEILTAVKNILAVRSDVKIFASLKLNGAETFPTWARATGSTAVLADKYALILWGFVQWCKTNQIPIHVLGIDNEMEYNKADINPAKYIEVVDALKAKYATDTSLTFPQLIAPECYGPGNSVNWMTTFNTKNRNSLVDIIGTHYYPELRPLAKLQALSALRNGRPLWHTEVHWTKRSDTEIAAGKALLSEFESCVIAVFDCFDLGATGMTWWSYNKANAAENIFTHSTDGYVPATVIYKTSQTLAAGNFATRAFVKDNSVSLWALNCKNSPCTDYVIKVKERSINGAISVSTWTSTAWTQNTTTPIQSVIAGDAETFKVSLPANSIVLLKFSYK